MFLLENIRTMFYEFFSFFTVDYHYGFEQHTEPFRCIDARFYFYLRTVNEVRSKSSLQKKHSNLS